MPACACAIAPRPRSWPLVRPTRHHHAVEGRGEARCLVARARHLRVGGASAPCRFKNAPPLKPIAVPPDLRNNIHICTGFHVVETTSFDLEIPILKFSMNPKFWQFLKFSERPIPKFCHSVFNKTQNSLRDGEKLSSSRFFLVLGFFLLPSRRVPVLRVSFS